LRRPEIVQALPLLARAHRRGALLSASCSATFVLGAAGVLDGREATTTWWLGAEFARRFPHTRLRDDRMVVASEDVITAGSALAHADLMLVLLARLAGLSLAETAARYLVLDERASQAHYMIHEHLRGADPALSRLERFVAKNLGRQLELPELARAALTSPRTLARRLRSSLNTTPQRFVQRIRVERAVHLLATTRQPVDEIAARVGYADAAAFRRVLRRETGRSPRDLRAAHDASAIPT
jgi:transcriptional regulator GlxA family with amidase domain